MKCARPPKQGDAAAQCYLGICYQTGQGVAQDYAEAVKWFRRAADQNDEAAQCYLGFCYQTGLGVPQEFGQAAKWFREAAEQGDPGGAVQSGRALRDRPGRAAELCRGGEVVSCRRRARRTAGAIQPGRLLRDRPGRAAELRGGGEMVSRSPPNRNARPRNATSASATETGRGVPQNVREAVKWFCRAARAGDKTAQHNLGVYYADARSRRGSHCAGRSPGCRNPTRLQRTRRPEPAVERTLRGSLIRRHFALCRSIAASPTRSAQARLHAASLLRSTWRCSR